MNIVFDFDSTLLGCEGLDLIAELKGVSLEKIQRLEEITIHGMNGEIPLEQSISERLKLMEFTRSEVASYLPTFYERISTSVLRNLDFFAERKNEIYVISGGFRDFVVPVSEFIGFKTEHIFANSFSYEGDKIVGLDTDSPLYRNGDKPKLLQKMELQSPVIMIGDGSTDYETRAEGQADFLSHIPKM